MSNETEKMVKKLGNNESAEISGGQNSAPKEERIYVCHRPSFKHPITLKYGVPCPDTKFPGVDVDPKPLYGVPSPYPKRENNPDDQIIIDDETND